MGILMTMTKERLQNIRETVQMCQKASIPYQGEVDDVADLLDLIDKQREALKLITIITTQGQDQPLRRIAREALDY